MDALLIDTWTLRFRRKPPSPRSSVRPGRGLARLAALCGSDFAGGFLLYNGRDILPLADERMLAVPLSELWTR